MADPHHPHRPSIAFEYPNAPRPETLDIQASARACVRCPADRGKQLLDPYVVFEKCQDATMSLAGPVRLHCMNAMTFTDVLTVAVPVTDQDAAKALYERLGFEARLDTELQPGFRWIELTLPAGGTTISLVAAGDELPAGVDTGIRLATGDARAAHEAVRGLGLNAGELLDWETAPLMFSFVDPDGNRFYVTEAPDR